MFRNLFSHNRPMIAIQSGRRNFTCVINTRPKGVFPTEGTPASALYFLSKDGVSRTNALEKAPQPRRLSYSEGGPLNGF
jgi:hypothetical protein